LATSEYDIRSAEASMNLRQAQRNNFVRCNIVKRFPKGIFKPDACTLPVQSQTSCLAGVSVGILPGK